MHHYFLFIVFSNDFCNTTPTGIVTIPAGPPPGSFLQRDTQGTNGDTRRWYFA
jgi:hypothetical protein